MKKTEGWADAHPFFCGMLEQLYPKERHAHVLTANIPSKRSIRLYNFVKIVIFPFSFLVITLY